MTTLHQRDIRAVHVAKQAKHQLFVVRKKVRRVAKRASVHGSNGVYRLYAHLRPHRYIEGMYSGEFLDGPVEKNPKSTSLSNVIYCFWTGQNELTTNRARNLRILQERNPETEVILVTPDNLAEFVVPEHPLHPAYEHLSLVHKSDYLRAYFMHHHGGGYTDIKEPAGAWLPSFESLRQNPDKWVLGYREISSDMCAQLPGRLGRDLRVHYRSIVGNGAFIMRPGTPLTSEWCQELDARLDSYADALAQHPGDARGKNPGYPISWRKILADIFQPLNLKYRDHLIIDDRIKPSFRNYK